MLAQQLVNGVLLGATYALFAGELYAWFVVGEIVGRGFTLVDYDV